jgi:hypothetical protein
LYLRRVAMRRRVQCSRDEGLLSCASTFTARSRTPGP